MKKTPDFMLIIVTLSLLTIGMIMVYSASAVWASYKMGTHSFCKKTITVCGSWCSSYVFIMKIDYWVWRTYSKVILLVCFILLILVLIPGVGLVRGGARSWIGIGAFSIQPSEFMKVAMIIFLAKFLAERQKLITSFKRGLLPLLVLCFLLLG